MSPDLGPGARGPGRAGAAIADAESLPPPAVESMFADVHAEMPPHIEEQMRYAIAMDEGQKVEGAFPL